MKINVEWTVIEVHSADVEVPDDLDLDNYDSYEEFFGSSALAQIEGDDTFDFCLDRVVDHVTAVVKEDEPQEVETHVIRAERLELGMLFEDEDGLLARVVELERTLDRLVVRDPMGREHHFTANQKVSVA
jgi:hypothetical protein